MTDRVIENIKRRYYDMMGRCYNPKLKNYKHYGGKGIKVCDEWLEKEGKSNFINWSLENGYSKELSIDRIDNTGDYSPSNCRWVNGRTQNINKSPSIKNTTGYTGIYIHSSSYEGHVYYYGRVRDRSGKTKYTGMPKDILEAVKKRNEYIIDNELDNTLNYIDGDLI